MKEGVINKLFIRHERTGRTQIPGKPETKTDQQIASMTEIEAQIQLHTLHNIQTLFFHWHARQTAVLGNMGARSINGRGA